MTFLLVIVTRIICYSVIFISVYRRLPEFSGYKPVVFPGTVGPRTQIIAPRRMNLPPNFASDWKRIGSKRTNMLMLDVPLWPKQTRKKKYESFVQIDTNI